MKKIDTSMIIKSRPTGIPKNTHIKPNAEYSIGETLDEVKANILRTRKLISKNNMHSSALKVALIMNIGNAFRHRNDAEWFDENYSFQDFLKECRIVEKSARSYEQYFEGLLFYRSLGVEISHQPIRNIHALCTKALITNLKANDHPKEVDKLKDLIDQKDLSRKAISKFKKEIGAFDAAKSGAPDNLGLFNFQVLADGIVVEYEKSNEGKIIKLLERYGTQVNNNQEKAN